MNVKWYPFKKAFIVILLAVGVVVCSNFKVAEQKAVAHTSTSLSANTPKPQLEQGSVHKIDTLQNNNLIYIQGTGGVQYKTVVYTDVSNKFNYTIYLSRKLNADYLDTVFVKIAIKDKLEKSQQLLDVVTCNCLGDDKFMEVRSYITGKNVGVAVSDNDFGDFVIADFNFDAKEDFAVKIAEGGNGGPIYAYFIQHAVNGTFVKDDFLSSNVQFFPVDINSTNKTITTLVHANAYEQCKKVFCFNTKLKQWQLVSKTFVSY